MEDIKHNILLITFNRLEPTIRVIQEINNYSPKILYISSDAGRTTEEKLIVSKIRKYISDNINNETQIKTLYQKENLGCKRAVTESLNWFFKHEDAGIILEDDCIPNKSFFEFMNINLVKFKKNENILSINGCNFGYQSPEGNAFITSYMNMWGWATWKRSADKIKYEISSKDIFQKSINIYKFLRKCHKNSRLFIIYFYWLIRFLRVKKIDTWDYYWHFYQFSNNKYSIVPGYNLISNIGFNQDATHTKSSDIIIANLNVYEIPENKINLIDLKLSNEFENKIVTKIWENISLKNLIKSLYAFLLK